jgi:hypothetical protein
MCAVLSNIDSMEDPARSLNISRAALLIMHEIFGFAHDINIKPADSGALFETFENFCSLQNDYKKGRIVQETFRSAMLRSTAMKLKN